MLREFSINKKIEVADMILIKLHDRFSCVAKVLKHISLQRRTLPFMLLLISYLALFPTSVLAYFSHIPLVLLFLKIDQ